MKNINHLLTAFYNGETTAKEEQELRQYFETTQVPPELQQEKEIFLSMFESSDKIIVPQSLEYQIESAIDKLDFERRNPKVAKKKSWVWISGIAASFALIFSVGIYFFSQNKELYFAENQKVTEQNLSETDRQKIAEARAALVLVSTKFNKGINQLAMIDKDFNKINKNLGKINKITLNFNN